MFARSSLYENKPNLSKLAAAVPCFHNVKKHCFKNEWILEAQASVISHLKIEALSHAEKSGVFLTRFLELLTSDTYQVGKQ